MLTARRVIADHFQLRRLGFRRPSEIRFMALIATGQVATGVSSRALSHWALRLVEGDEPAGRPLDSGDYGRCVIAYEAAPPHIKRRMKPHMDRWVKQLNAELDSKRRKWDQRVDYVAAP